MTIGLSKHVKLKTGICLTYGKFKVEVGLYNSWKCEAAIGSFNLGYMCDNRVC